MKTARLPRRPVKPFVRLFVARLRAESDARLSSFTRFAPIERVRAEDMFVVGYPRSGNAWLQNLAAGVVYGVDPRYAPHTLVQEIVPDVHTERHYKRFATPTFFKSHALPKLEYRRMVRAGDGLFSCTWHAHVTAWLANPHQARVLTIRYEDLGADTVGQWQRFRAFADIERDEAFLKMIARHASCDETHAKEIRFGWEDVRWPRDQFFVRRGQVGSHRDEMEAEVLEAFLVDARDALAGCGYL